MLFKRRDWMKINKSIVFQRIWMFVIFFGMMFVGYRLNMFGYNDYGVKPRTFSLEALYGVAMHWTMHSSWEHIRNNSLFLIQLIPPFIIFEQKPIKRCIQLILIAGSFTWLFGAPHTNHVGASGLVFALIGYIFMTGIVTLRFFFRKNHWYERVKGLIYFGLSCFAILELRYLDSIWYGIFPEANNTSADHISIAGHLGGLIAGMLIAFYYKPKSKKQYQYVYTPTSKLLKELKKIK